MVTKSFRWLATAALALSPWLGAAQTSAQEINPETQVRKAYPADPAQIPLETPDGKRTTLSAVAPRVLLVAPFTSRFGDLLELKRAAHLMKAYAGNKNVAFIALNIDRPKSKEDWDVLREVMKENGIELPLYSDAQLSFLAWVNGPPEPGKAAMVRLPSVAVILNGKQLHGTYGLERDGTVEAYVAERKKLVEEALKAAKASGKAAPR